MLPRRTFSQAKSLRQVLGDEIADMESGEDTSDDECDRRVTDMTDMVGGNRLSV